MSSFLAFRRFVVFLAVLGMCLPNVAFSASPDAPAVADVRLQQGATLLGQVVDSQGTAVAGVPISLRNNGKDVAAGVTNPGGLFAFRGLNQGVYQVASGSSVHTFRVWSIQTAPPAAQQAALVVLGDGLVRGQRPLGSLLTSPLIIGGAIAAAIAIPIAVANSHHHPASP